jgi:hypothetical protein
MLLYTCEMVLEQARLTLSDLGAFANGKSVPAGAVPAASVLGSLRQSQSNAGIHINEFVPGMDVRFKAVGLKTDSLARLMKAWAGESGELV